MLHINISRTTVRSYFHSLGVLLLFFNIIRIKNISNIVKVCIPLDNHGFTLDNVHFIISSIYNSINIKEITPKRFKKIK